MVKIRLAFGVSVSLLLAIGACGPSKFVSTWKAPDATPVAIQGQKVAAFVMTLQKAARFPAEDALAQELTKRGLSGVAGYTIVDPDLGWDKEKALPLLQKAGVEGAVLMRPVGRETKISRNPAAAYYTGYHYPTFWGYWGYGWTAVYAPGYLNSDTIVSVETLLYSIKQDKLLWAGMSETTNPNDIPSFIKDLVGVAGKELREAGLVQR